MVIKRGTGSYKDQCDRVKTNAVQYGVKKTLHIHFNSHGYLKARGCEVICSDSNKFTGACISTKISEVFKIRNRGVKIQSRGGLMIRELGSVEVEAYIVEPCFASHRTMESMAIMEHEDRYVDFLLKIIMEIL